MPTAPKFTAQMRRRYEKLGTANVSDALDKLQIPGGIHGLVPIGSHQRKIVGPAFTVRYLPIGVGVAAAAGDYIDDVKPGEVVCLDNGGRTYCTAWGDILTLVASRKGIAGTVIDGVCRDVDGIIELGYSLFARGHYMVTGKGRMQMVGVQCPIQLSNVQVNPGDIIVADAAGVVRVPAEKAEEVLKLAEEIAAAEDGIMEYVKAGNTLAEARKKFKYDSLQSPGSK